VTSDGMNRVGLARNIHQATPASSRRRDRLSGAGLRRGPGRSAARPPPILPARPPRSARRGMGRRLPGRSLADAARARMGRADARPAHRVGVAEVPATTTTGRRTRHRGRNPVSVESPTRAGHPERDEGVPISPLSFDASYAEDWLDRAVRYAWTTAQSGPGDPRAQ
jgi:hypothetical protein